MEELGENKMIHGTEKTVKQKFTFPQFNVVIEADDIREAEETLKKYLEDKTLEDDKTI